MRRPGKERRKQKSVFKSYLITYMGLAITVCAVLGLALTVVSAKRLETQERNALESRLAGAGDDFCRQLELMQEIALRICTTNVYQPVYLQKGTLNEKQMLEHFSLLSNTSVLSDACFLFYPDRQTVYTMSTKMPLSVFIKQYAPQMSDEEFMELITQGHSFFFLDGDSYLFRKLKIPFNRYSHGSNAYLLLRMDQQALSEYYQGLFRLNSSLSMQMDGIVLLQGTSTQENLQYTTLYEGEELVLSVGEGSDGYAPSLWATMLGILAALSLTFSAISAYLAWKSYTPIKGLAQKVSGREEMAGNEIQLISAAVDHVIRQNSASLTLLTSSLESISRLRESLKQQILQLVLSGVYDLALSQRMAEAGLDFSGHQFCAAHIRYDPAISTEELNHLVSGQSTEDTRLYLAVLSARNGWALLMISQNEYDLLAAFDTVCEDLVRRYPDISIKLGTMFGQVQKLAYSLAVAQSEQESAPDMFEQNAQAAQMMEEMKKRIYSGAEEEALSHLNLLLQEASREPSLLFRRYRIVELVHQILTFARELNCQMNAQEVVGSLNHLDEEALHESLAGIVRKLCALSSRGEMTLSPSAKLIIDYVEQHAMDYEICLDSVASACDVSSKQISRVMRSVVGMSFREYVSLLRIRQAQELLKAGVSATETAHQVGYADISYFTKVFRSHVGCTPGQYRDSVLPCRGI